MEEEIQFYISETKEAMDRANEHTVSAFGKIRAGKASPSMLDSVKVDYYGSMTPLSQVASVNTPDARTIVVKPWEKPMLQPIERAIIESNLGFNPQNDGDLIRISVPPLSEERRRDLVKQAKQESENGKIGLRNARKEANDALKKLQKDGASEDMVKDAEGEVQKITDQYVTKIEELLAQKEDEITTI